MNTKHEKMHKHCNGTQGFLSRQGQERQMVQNPSHTYEHGQITNALQCSCTQSSYGILTPG